MLDELAVAAGKDPAQFRIDMLDGAGANAGGAQRLRNTLLAAMGLAGYGTKKLPKGEGMGVACVSSQERATASWTACVAHVAVDDSGEVKVKKLTVATDVGTQVNPDGIRAQVEGAALWGMSLALLEKATMKDGAIEQSNFDSYTPMRMSQIPEVALAVIANGEPATGVGEPAVTVVAPALANAIYNAVGARVRSLPITAEAVKATSRRPDRRRWLNGNMEAFLAGCLHFLSCGLLCQIIDRRTRLPQSAAWEKIRTGNPDKRRGLEKALLPILIFAPLVTVLCWTAAWIFRDEFIFKAVLIGLGGFAIVARWPVFWCCSSGSIATSGRGYSFTGIFRRSRRPRCDPASERGREDRDAR